MEWGSLEREINVWLPKRERERAVCTPEVGVPVVARGVGRGETADPEDHQRPSIEVTLDGRCEWRSSGFRREWMEKSAPLSWQHGIATPSPADCCSRARSVVFNHEAAPPPFAWYARPPVPRYSLSRHSLRLRAALPRMVCETRGLAPAAPPPASARHRTPVDWSGAIRCFPLSSTAC